ncbi:phytanoyl-CoA dioxygenase family protein [Streptomyces sp. NPDC088560]|uniref:phytanoyl-CoA dioxygenase family protein n=1 Tax=Streptomyces sp. NPDC088560 TaxID=3365868 RepID=UPI0038271079
MKIEGAVPADVAEAGARLLWRETGYDPHNPGTWQEPVVRLGDMAQGPFDAAVNSPVLHEAFDLLVGAGRWVPRHSLGGFPLRFPHPEEPDDAGWHIEGSYLPEGERWYFANLRSRDRALLMLFLFSEVTEADAPTRIRVGSHLDVPALLTPYGEAGASILELGPLLDRATEHRPLAHATGGPGDVYLCHPFLVHAAQPHHGTRPRFMAQPPLIPAVPCALERADGAYSPVETAIRRGLGRP